MPAKHTPKHTSPTPRPALVTQEEKTPKPEERVSKFARQVFARVRSRLESEWESFLERATMEEQRLMIEILNDYANQTAGAATRPL